MGNKSLSFFFLIRKKNTHYNEEETLSYKIQGDVFIMKALFNGLKVNENDTVTTAFAKGMTEGALKSGLLWLTVAGAVYVVGKLTEKKEVEVETEEDDKE